MVRDRTRQPACIPALSLRPVTVLVSASGAPGTAALLRALRENGEREIRLVGTDLSERSVGRHLCDSFHLVPAGTDAEFVDAMLEVVAREEVDVVLPQSSFDLQGLADQRERFDIPVLVSPANAIVRSNDKAESYALLHRLGVPAPEFKRVRGAAEVAAAHELGHPDRPRPASSRSSRRARAASGCSTPRSTGRTSSSTSAPAPWPCGSRRPSSSCRRKGGPDLLVMELATGEERTIDGIADGTRGVLGHPKTREAIRAGLATYFVTLEDWR